MSQPFTLWESRYKFPSDEDLRKLHTYCAKRKGYVYVIAAKEHPEWGFKIGRTKNDPFKRARQFGSAGVLINYDVKLAYSFLNTPWAESYLHRKLNKVQVGKEWYKVTEPEIKIMLDELLDLESKLISAHLNIELLAGADEELFVTSGLIVESFI